MVHFYQPNPILNMKKVFAIFASLALAGSVFAGCPSKPFKAKLVGFDKESKTLTLKAGKKDIKVKVGSKTEMAGFECPTKLAAGASLEIHGCNCANQEGQASRSNQGSRCRQEERKEERFLIFFIQLFAKPPGNRGLFLCSGNLWIRGFTQDEVILTLHRESPALCITGMSAISQPLENLPSQTTFRSEPPA